MARSRIVLDGEAYLLVHRSDLLSAWDDSARRELVLACLADPAGRAAARRLVDELTGGISLGTSDVARELDRLLETGRVIAVRERGAVRLLDPPGAHDPVWGRDDPGSADDPVRPVAPPPRGPDDPIAPGDPSVDTTWIEVHLVDDDGRPVSGERIAVRFPDGSETQAYLDADGRWRLDGIPHGTYQVCFPDADGMWRPARPATPKTRPVVRRCTAAACRYGDGAVLPSLPSHRDGVALVAALAAMQRDVAASPGHELYVVGRRGPAERTEHDVARLRADALVALLGNDAATWVETATRAGSYAEVERLLAEIGEALGWPCDPGATDGVETGASHDAVRAFQQTYNVEMAGEILEDGVCGEETLGALFALMRRELEATATSCAVDLDTRPIAALHHRGVGSAPIPGDGDPCDVVGGTVELLAARPGVVDLGALPPVSDRAVLQPVKAVDVRLGRPGEPDWLALVLLDDRGDRMSGTHYVARFGNARSIEGTADDRGVARLPMPKVCMETMDIAWGPTDEDLGFRYARRIYVDCTEGPTKRRARAVLHNLGYVPAPLSDAVWAFQATYGVDLDPRPRGLVDGEIPAETLSAIGNRFDEIVRG